MKQSNSTLKKWMRGVFASSLALTVAACSGGGQEAKPADSNNTGGQPSGEAKPAEPEGDQKLIIYTARDKNIFEIVLPKFNEKYPNIEVETLEMGAQQILERVRAEKANPQADFWWGGTQSALSTAADEGLLEPYKPTFADKIPDLYKDPQDRWYGEMLLPEVIMYNSEALKPEEVPQDWDELIDPKYKDKIVIRNVLPSGTMRTIYSAMIYRQGPDTPEKGYEWLKKLDANTKEYTQDPTNLYLKLDRQEGVISLWNLQDVLIQSKQNNHPYDFVYPKSGAPILVDGVGLIKGAKNADAAKKFYEFLFSPEIAAQLAKERFQFPSRTDINKDDLPDFMKNLELKPLELDWKVMAEKEKEWMQHWDENIKGKGKK
ncbi:MULTISPECIES: extracellular solute-binding protein [Brevibacillus]|uniref:extracellular solute-binding protein n=2 Tax=Brevibacillus TaxID=55080 RepID=UPI000469DC37|nr:extracellular solute-binding protein [Brevibacillus borstelensis]MCC0564768.1 extracellular solute-binding protein [Brevibacillus borstelensis]MCM3468796.1 extracellular solute-binding protein [Brevibacillus borstelensis]MCM3557007.1 extracellular solute-binding protein [Brevibacillus borstelensis]MCM3589997.1 extracellular solute-binding protein [Brevibacillus borstelensis]MCM3621470.1 extracellular solute-binding protein [Brevibacillus borstelensis]